jgi:hypothetical protein
MKNIRRKYPEKEKEYRNKPDTKKYQSDYQRLYRLFLKGEISPGDFEVLKPIRKDYSSNN